jgi:hypothetical protein
VLVLYSNNRLLTANVEFDSALRQTINANSGQPIQIFPSFWTSPNSAATGTNSPWLPICTTSMRNGHRMPCW